MRLYIKGTLCNNWLVEVVLCCWTSLWIFYDSLKDMILCTFEWLSESLRHKQFFQLHANKKKKKRDIGLKRVWLLLHSGDSNKSKVDPLPPLEGKNDMLSLRAIYFLEPIKTSQLWDLHWNPNSKLRLLAHLKIITEDPSRWRSVLVMRLQRGPVQADFMGGWEWAVDAAVHLQTQRQEQEPRK